MIRLQRIGRKNDPAFRILVLEKTASPKAGTYADLVGTYNPKTKAFQIDMDRVKDWIGKGAQLSPSLHNLLIEKGLMTGKKFASVSKTNMEKNKAKVEEAAAVSDPDQAVPAEKAPVGDPAEAAPEEVVEPAAA